MKVNALLIEEKTNGLAMLNPCTGTKGFYIVDYRTNTGTEEDPMWEPQELPAWFIDTETTPAKWNGKELVRDE